MSNRIFLILGACLLVTSVALAAGLPGVKWVVMGSGGGPVANGKVEINGTVGQPVAGRVSNGELVLYSGYWTGVDEIFLPRDEAVFLPLVVL